jgi:3-oxoacyl-[acyl-carrier-protein] synthase III
VVAQEALQAQSLSGEDIDLVVASPALPVFTKIVSGQLGIPEDRFVTLGETLHTVAFVAALDRAVRTGRMWRGDKVLFLCGAAGLTAGAALYQAG